MPFVDTSSASTSSIGHSESSFTLLRKRLLLLASGDHPSGHDQLSWAELCLDQGLTDVARMLFEVAYIRQGLSRQWLARQARTPAEAALWPVEATPEAAPPTGSATVDIAGAEIARFARAVAAHILARLRLVAAVNPLSSPRADRAVEDPPGGNRGDAAGEAVNRLFLALGRPTSADALRDVAAAADRLKSICEQSPEADHRAFGAASLPLLGTAIGFAGVREIVTGNHDLLWGAFGSAEVFHRAARFDSAGLGPYFSNVQRLARKSRDVFELAHMAREAAGEAGDDTGLEPWMGFLSRCVGGALLNEVIDDLGDIDARVALSTIFERAASLPDRLIDLAVIMRVRDASLDNRDYDLAARAQAVVVRLRPGSLLERVILGNIDGSAGRIGAAEQSFLGCLEASPGDQDVIRRLAAVRSRAFEPYAVQGGFGTPEDRRIVRERRRAG